MVGVYLIVSIIFSNISAVVSNKECRITDFLTHQNGYSHQYVFHSNCPLDHSQHETGNDNEVKIFIPYVVKDAAVRKNIEKMNEGASTSYYSMKMWVKDGGIECVINLNPNNLYAHNTPLELQKTTSITGKHGLLIKLHDGDALNKMQARSGEKRIRMVAHANITTKPTIVLDYGHGGSDSGYCDTKTGLQEKHINKSIGDKVAHLLKKKITKSV